MKPHEETWTARWDEDYGATYVNTPCKDDTICVDDHAKAELISAAPDMARVLLGLEWSGSQCVDIEWYSPACPSCGGCDPDQWTETSREKIRREGFTLGHKPDCEWVAALAKAGVRPADGLGGGEG